MQEMQETRILFLGREDVPGVGNGNPLQYSCLENSMNREACRLQSMESQRVRHYWVHTHTHTHTHTRFSESSKCENAFYSIGALTFISTGTFHLSSNCKCFMDVVTMSFSSTLPIYAFDVGELSVSNKCLQLVSILSIFHCHFKNHTCDFCIHDQYRIHT